MDSSLECTDPGDVRILPTNYQFAGTCGNCGGPVIAPIVWSDDCTAREPLEYCMDCGARPKKKIYPSFGPIMEMEFCLAALPRVIVSAGDY